MWNNQNPLAQCGWWLGVVAADVGLQTHLSHNIVMSRSWSTLVTRNLATYSRCSVQHLHHPREIAQCLERAPTRPFFFNQEIIKTLS